MSYSVVRQAILDRHSLTARYAGQVLHFSPHALGRGADRAFRVVAFQYAARGGAPMARGGRWRCLRLCRLTHLVPNADGWQSGHDYRRPLKCVVQLDVGSW
jgi:hypothetical protein